MILKGIPYRIWEKVISRATTFFFIVALLSPFLALNLYLFESDLVYLVAREAGSTKKDLSHDHLFCDNSPIKSVLDRPNVPYIPIPDVKKFISFESYNRRPDAISDKGGHIALSSSSKSLLAHQNECIYLTCKNLKTMEFSKKATPYRITPLDVVEDTLHARFDIVYKDQKGDILYETSKQVTLVKEGNPESLSLSKNTKDSLLLISKAQAFEPDSLISLKGGKEYAQQQGMHRLYIPKNSNSPSLGVKEGDILSFSKGAWKKGGAKKKPIFQITAVSSNGLKGIFWNENGFIEKELVIPASSAKPSIHSFAFEKLYKRNNESIICKLDGRTFLLKPNDWLVKRNSFWTHVRNINDFNNIMELKLFGNLIIFEGIKKIKEEEFFIGYLFDESRSNFKKLEIPLKKKESLGYNK